MSPVKQKHAAHHIEAMLVVFLVVCSTLVKGITLIGLIICQDFSK